MISAAHISKTERLAPISVSNLEWAVPFQMSTSKVEVKCTHTHVSLVDFRRDLPRRLGAKNLSSPALEHISVLL